MSHDDFLRLHVGAVDATQNTCLSLKAMAQSWPFCVTLNLGFFRFSAIFYLGFFFFFVVELKFSLFLQSFKSAAKGGIYPN